MRQTRWSRLGAWERLLVRARQRGFELDMTFLTGTSDCAHQQAGLA